MSLQQGRQVAAGTPVKLQESLSGMYSNAKLVQAVQHGSVLDRSELQGCLT